MKLNTVIANSYNCESSIVPSIVHILTVAILLDTAEMRHKNCYLNYLTLMLCLEY